MLQLTATQKVAVFLSNEKPGRAGIHYLFFPRPLLPLPVLPTDTEMVVSLLRPAASLATALIERLPLNLRVFQLQVRVQASTLEHFRLLSM